MFFQAMLFIGYLYAHVVGRKLGGWHLLVLALPLLNLPLGVAVEATSQGAVFTLLKVLLLHIAGPFAVLSTTAVMAQSWLSQSTMGKKREAYSLYSVSNAGSLIALLGYPFLVEPVLGLKAQSIAWSGGYLLYAGLIIGSWFNLRPRGGPQVLDSETNSSSSLQSAPRTYHYASWLLLSFLPSAFLLTVTNFIAAETGSYPMVWVIPLALYLLSFVVIFRRNGGVPKALNTLWLEIGLLGFLLYMLPSLGWPALIGHLFVLFATCLVAHGELYGHRPPVQYLTSFYLTIALGGWLGGFAVSMLAPVVFTGLYDYPIALMALTISFVVSRRTSLTEFWRKASFTVAGCRMMVMAILLLFITFGVKASLSAVERFRHRNFYGTYRIIDDPTNGEIPGGLRRLVHGSTLHGAQLLAQDKRHKPTSYYYLGGGIAQVFESIPSPRRIAVVGLGAGVVATYARSNDILRFYEIDPDNEGIARIWFTYLDDTEAQVQVIVGDGRVGLRKKAGEDGDYDIVFVDAFSGDGIPTHLLTREAIETYLKRLKENGLILLHISNRYYDLRPVVKATAAELGLLGVMNVPPQKRDLRPYETPSQCVVLTKDAIRLERFIKLGWITFGNGDGLEKVRPWTDDYVNILTPLVAKLRQRGKE
jgi:hypothetical protein